MCISFLESKEKTASKAQKNARFRNGKKRQVYVTKKRGGPSRKDQWSESTKKGLI